MQFSATRRHAKQDERRFKQQRRNAPIQFGIVVVLLAILVAVAYANTLRNGFVWDDHKQIVMNPDLRSSVPLLHLFSSDVWAFENEPTHGNYYRPLQMWTYRATAAIAGFDPIAFHLLSIVFALAATILAFTFYWRITGSMEAAFAAAALFAVHPVHSEAVDWASALPDIGCTIFVLAAFLFFLFTDWHASDDRLRPAWLRRTLWTFSLICFAAALLWKETAAVFPLLVLTYSQLSADTDSTTDRLLSALRRSFPYWALLVGYLILRLQILGHLAIRQRNWVLTPFQYGLTVVHLLTAYCAKLIVPLPLNAYRVFSPVTSAMEWRSITGILFLLLPFSAIACSARRAPKLAFAALWLFITILPVMDIYAVGRNVFAERYLYLPSVGFCLLVVLLAVRILQWIAQPLRKYVAVSALGLAILPSISTTIARNRDWKDDSTLFSRTLETSPAAPFVHNMVAASQPENSSQAEAHYAKALSLAAAEAPPDKLQMAMACEGLAWIYGDRTDFSRALGLLQRVREMDPSDPEVDGEQGLLLSRAGRWREAETYLDRAIARSNVNENVLNGMGMIAWEYHHDLNAAAGYFSRALGIHSANDDFAASLHNNLGAVYGEQGNFLTAIGEFESAVNITRNDPEYRTNLARALLAAGRQEEASSEIRMALEISPTYAPARALLQDMTAR
jgi:tetratricopeptide (TPR) repeat protein